jgi:CBS domain-containing protein
MPIFSYTPPMMKKKSWVDITSLRQLQQKRQSLRPVELFPYSEEIRSVMVSPVFTCAPSDNLKGVVKSMSEKKISCILAVNENREPTGILTERDILRRVVAAGVNIDSATVESFMTADPLTLTPGDTVYRALFLLSARGIKHLPLVEDGKVVGIVTLRQLIKLRYPEPMSLIEGISQAADVDSLRRIKERLPGLAASKLSMGMRAYDVVVMLSLINQDIHRRVFELAIADTGEPPAPCCLFLTGSHGRMENLLSTDQDHGFIIDDSAGAHESIFEYYKQLARTFSAWLEEVGFEKCPGEVMAVNPVWNRSLFEWKTQLEHWIIKQVPHLVRYVTVFFDALPVWGDEKLFHDLMDHAYALLGQHYEVLRMLHEEEGRHRVPTGMFGRWITERSGEHRGEFDIKRSGLIFVVEGVRILALLHGVRETTTVKRITKLVDGGHVNPDDGEYFEGAYRFLLHFALNAQVEKAFKEGRTDTYLNPSRLSSREKEMLRHAYRAVASLQELIASEFGELVL